VKDSRSPKHDLVNNVFAAERPANVDTWKEEEKGTIEDIIECLICFVEERKRRKRNRSLQHLWVSEPGVWRARG